MRISDIYAYLCALFKFAILFPGEASDRLNPRLKQSAKDSVWALYCRSMLLWNFSYRLNQDTISDNVKAEYAFEVWVETQSIQDAVDSHVCNLDTALLYMCREHLYKCVFSFNVFVIGSLTPLSLFTVLV